jgi:hypothetical protein
LNRVCVATSKSLAYYSIVSRLRRAEIPFDSLLPDSDFRDCGLILTTASEVRGLPAQVLTLEDMAEDPGVFKAQVVSMLDGKDDLVLVGVDPGNRTGFAVFYGHTRIWWDTFGSLPRLSSKIAEFSKATPTHRMVVRVGNGDGAVASKLVRLLKSEVPGATIELVDESGTSTRIARMKGVSGDQVAAARIAFRKGQVVSSGEPKTPR